MKKLTLCLMLILTLIFPGVVFASDVSTDVVAQENVAQIGDTKYATIAEALEAVPTDGTETTITLLKSVEKGTGFRIVEGQNVVIDFAGFTYDAAEPLVGSTGTVTNGCQLRKDSTVIFKNGTLVTTSGEAYILIQNYSDLTLNNMTIDATGSTSEYAMSNNNGKVDIIGNTSIKGNKYAFDMCWAPNKGYPEGTQITVNTTGTITGDIELGVWGTYSDTDGIKSTLTIENINHVGNVVVSDERLANQLTITGGTFSSDVTNYIPEYYVCNQLDSNYIVQKLHDVKVNYTVGGTASSDVIRAYEGRKVGLTLTPDEGYEVKEIKITDEEGVSTVITEHFFTMPNSAVTVDVTFAKVVKQEVTVPDVVEKDEKVEDILLDSLKKDEDFKDVVENNNVEVKVEVSEEKVEETEKEEIKEKLDKENVTVGKYFDITIAVKNKDTGVTEGTIDELTEAIKFTIEVPEDLPEVAEGFARKYFIIRNHEGEIKYLDVVVSEDGKTLSFETDKFSTYVLAYKDEAITGEGETGEGEGTEEPKEEVKEEEKEEEKIEQTTQPDVPNTGDNIVLYVLLAVVALAGIIIIKKADTKK